MPDDRRFWLFKSEPGSFSFADLKSRPGGIEPWDGVRNFQARNFLRDQVRVGDGVLFYHSSIPRPAVVGIARVARAGYPDPTAWDPTSRHFDPRSTPALPGWFMVDVQYERTFVHEVPLDELKHHPELAGMVLLQRSRLSVQPVTAAEWSFILRLGGIAPESI